MSTVIVGNVGREPELKFLPSGVGVAKFSVAVSKRVQKDGQWTDGETTWYRVTAWRALAEHVAESLAKGTKVIVSGELKETVYDKDGQEQRGWELVASEVGVALSNQKASVSRVERRQGREQLANPLSAADVVASLGGKIVDEQPPF